MYARGEGQQKHACHSYPSLNDASSVSSTHGSSEARFNTDHNNPAYDKDVDGEPCQQLNWGMDCGFIMCNFTHHHQTLSLYSS